jgi:2',3'-cyclic-nucleotide 2'-phosphodiesterase (5'-nucleotidase family)
VKKHIRIISFFLILCLCFSIFVACDEVTNEDESNGNNSNTVKCEDGTHVDVDDNGSCDICEISLFVYIDFYAINDLHGKFSDTSSNNGVDELTTYLKNTSLTDEHTVFLSSGDMWQGSSESNLTNGKIITEWMNELGFASMTLGNHEFDWGEEYIIENAALAEFPMLAINIYDRTTNQRVEYCESSVLVECRGLQVGIIGAIGDHYSSISGDKSQNIYFKTGSELTALVKAESDKLRAAGADLIVYSLHSGYGSNGTGSISKLSQQWQTADAFSKVLLGRAEAQEE